jgi:hypothetical protein
MSDRWAVGNGFLCRPGLEVITQGMHITVRADARVTEQIPGTPNSVASLQNGKTRTGTIPLELNGGANTRQPSAYDDDLKVGTG